MKRTPLPKALRLKKQVMAVFICKAYDFVLDTRAVPWPCGLQTPRIHRTFFEPPTHHLMRPSMGVCDVTWNL